MQPQCRLNPKAQDVVKVEIVKLLDAGLIYAISDSPWISLIHVVPKKGGMTAITNDKNKLVPIRTVIGWRIWHYLLGSKDTSGLDLTLRGILRRNIKSMRSGKLRFTTRRYIRGDDGEVMFISFICRDLLGPPPSYTSIREPLRRLCHRLIAFTISSRGRSLEKVTTIDLFFLRSMDEGTVVNVPYFLAHYLFRHAWGRKMGAQMIWEVRDLPTIDPEELITLRICKSVLGGCSAWSCTSAGTIDASGSYCSSYDYCTEVTEIGGEGVVDE
ncbi:hypothetical protein Tco_0775658 [Tanacetum coccineum]